MQRELEIRAKINAILTEGEEPEQLNESAIVGVVFAIGVLTAAVLKSMDGMENGFGAPGHEIGHHPKPKRQQSFPSIFGGKAEKIYRDDMLATLSQAYDNAVDLARRYPQARQVFETIANKIRRFVILTKSSGRELEDASKEIYEWMYRAKQWAIGKEQELEHQGRS